MSLELSNMRILLCASVVSFLVGAAISSKGYAESSSEAFYIEPMEIKVRPDSLVPSVLEVFNKEQHTAAIHIDIFERSDTVDGAEKRAITKDVSIDTTDLKLAAGQSKKLALVYHGSRKISRERAFRIVVRQVGASEDNSLDVRFVYVASMYVTPKLAEPKLVVQRVHRASEREVEVTLSNHGLAHVQMSDVAFVILQGALKGPVREIGLSSESRQNWAKQNLLAGSSRKLKLEIGPEEKPVAEGFLSLKFTNRDSKRNSE